MFGYITRGFLRIFGYVLEFIKYSISVPPDRGGFGGWNLMLTQVRRFRYVCTLQNTCRPHVIKTIKRHYVHIWIFLAGTFGDRKKWLRLVKKMLRLRALQNSNPQLSQTPSSGRLCSYARTVKKAEQQVKYREQLITTALDIV